MIEIYSRAGCPQPAETILNLDGPKSFVYAEIIPIEVMISDGGLRASRPTVVLKKIPFCRYYISRKVFFQSSITASQHVGQRRIP